MDFVWNRVDMRVLGAQPNPFSAPRQHVEVGDGVDVDTAMRAERNEVRVPCDKSIDGSGDGYRKDLIVIRIPTDAWDLNRRHHLGDCLELGSRRCSPIARPATRLYKHGLQLTEDRGTDDQRVITTDDMVEETSRASTKVERRHQHIGVENNPHSAWWLATRAAATRFHGCRDGVFSQGAGSRSFFSIPEELIPSSAPLCVLAERFAQEFAACPALLVRQAVDFDRQLWRERDGHRPGRPHESTITRSLTRVPRTTAITSRQMPVVRCPQLTLGSPRLNDSAFGLR